MGRERLGAGSECVGLGCESAGVGSPAKPRVGGRVEGLEGRDTWRREGTDRQAGVECSGQCKIRDGQMQRRRRGRRGARACPVRHLPVVLVRGPSPRPITRSQAGAPLPTSPRPVCLSSFHSPS